MTTKMTRQTTAPDDAKQLQAQAAEYAQRAADVRAELGRRAAQQAQERAERERAAAAARVSEFSRARLDQEVADARRVFDAELAANPLIRTIADYLTAMGRRDELVNEPGAVIRDRRQGHRAPRRSGAMAGERVLPFLAPTLPAPSAVRTGKVRVPGSGGAPARHHRYGSQ